MIKLTKILSSGKNRLCLDSFLVGLATQRIYDSLAGGDYDYKTAVSYGVCAVFFGLLAYQEKKDLMER